EGLHLTRRSGVPAGGLRLSICFTPCSGATVQLGNKLGLTALELCSERLAEEVVVAVPDPTPIERYDERRGLLERLELRRRAALLVEHRIAQWSAHAVEHGGAR